MKNQVTQFTLIAIVILLSACGKKDNLQPDNNAGKVKTYTEEIISPNYSNSVTLNISYDANNRITDITSATSPGNKFSFTYQSNDHYSMDIYNSGTIEIHEEFFMKNAYLDSTVQYNDSKDTMTEKYFYNTEQQLTKMLEYEYEKGPHLTNAVSYTYDVAGNMIKSTDTDRNTDTYEYHADLVYVMPQIMPFFNSPKKMNLVKTHTLTSNGYLVGSTISTYTFDSNDRISTIKETANDGTVSTKTFTYY